MLIRAVFAALLAVSLACAGTPDAKIPVNQLINGSFEQGREPWFDFQRPDKPYWGGFEVSDEQAFDGHHSLRLQLDSENFPGQVGIVGAVQNIDAQFMPRRLTGRYRVDQWQRGPRAQYIQLVVMAFAARNFQDLKASAQTAFVLAGVDTPPFEILNRRFAFLGPVEPEMGRWISFDIDLHREFERLWGKVPEDMKGARIFLEARFDGFTRQKDNQGLATVYFDALHLGD
jgi:hypothetical protein